MQGSDHAHETTAPVRSSLRLGPAGRIVLPVFLLVSLLAWAAGGVALLFVALGCAVGAAAILSAFRQGRGVTLRAQPSPPHWTGEPFLFELEMRAPKGRRIHRDLLLCRGSSTPSRSSSERPIGFLAQLAGGQSASLTCGHAHLQRGRTRELSIGLASTYPFGLLRIERHFVLAVDMMSWPRLGSWRGNLRLFARRNQLQEHAARQSGTDEFRQLSAWRAGMNPRRIHWRQSERRGQWLVRELENRTSGPIELELLTAIVDGRGHVHGRRSSFETAVSLIATLVDHHLREGARLTLRITGPEESTGHSYRGRTGRVAALDLLAEVQSTAVEPAILEELLAKAARKAPTQLVYAGGRGVQVPQSAERRLTQFLDVDAPDLDKHFRRSKAPADAHRAAREELAG